MLFRRSHRAIALAGLAALCLVGSAACSGGESSVGDSDADAAGDAVAADGLDSELASPDADADAASPDADADTTAEVGPDGLGDAPDADAPDSQTDTDGADAPDADTDATPAGPAMRFLSTPPALAVVGKGWAYEPILDLPGDAVLALDAAPEGMVLGDDGRLQWTSDAGGEATVTVSATLGDSTAVQSFVVIAASPVPLASASIGASGGLVKPAGAAPELAGVGISVPAGALADLREISMATLAGAPAPSALAGAATTTPLLLEPTGTAFATPVRVTLRYPAALDAAAAAGELDAWLMDETTGDWDSAPVVQIDAVERLLTVEVNHFSVLIAGTNGFDLALEVQDTTEVEGCVRHLTVNAALAQQLAEIPVTAALTKRPDLLAHAWDALADTSLAQLVADPTSAGTLRVLWVAELLGSSGQVVGTDALAVSLEAFAGGAGRLVVARPDGSAGLIADIADRAADASFASIARGEGLTFRFKPPTPVGASPKLRVRVHFRAEDGAAGEAPYLTTNQGAPLTEALSQVAATVALLSGDADCDGVLDTIDPAIETGTPEILQLPAASATVNVGDVLNLACEAVGPAGADALTFTWTSSGSGDELVPTTGSAGAPDGVAFKASSAGVRLVGCATGWQDAPLTAAFTVKVVKAATPCGGSCDDLNPCTKDSYAPGHRHLRLRSGRRALRRRRPLHGRRRLRCRRVPERASPRLRRRERLHRRRLRRRDRGLRPHGPGRGLR
ncbi:MAG: hypothetical protein R3F39_20535 [Myxococcota bacterium]